MTDACIVCECEAVDTEEWYYCEKTCEFVCPWCVKEMWKIKSAQELHGKSKVFTLESDAKVIIEDDSS